MPKKNEVITPGHVTVVPSNQSSVVVEGSPSTPMPNPSSASTSTSSLPTIGSRTFERLSPKEPEFFAMLTPDVIRKHISQTATAQEVDLFLIQSRMWALNPFKREIYLVKYGPNPAAIVIGFESFLKRAERTNKLRGWRAWTEGTVGPKQDEFKACVEIYRADWDKPFVHEVYYTEYVAKTKDGAITKFWREKPRTMLKKVAISQGFRMCFPDELGGMPYTVEEINSIDVEVLPTSPTDPNAEARTHFQSPPAGSPKASVPDPEKPALPAAVQIILEAAVATVSKPKAEPKAKDKDDALTKLNEKDVVVENLRKMIESAAFDIKRFKVFLSEFQNEHPPVVFVGENKFHKLSLHEGKIEDLKRGIAHFKYLSGQYQEWEKLNGQRATSPSGLEEGEVHPGLQETGEPATEEAELIEEGFEGEGDEEEPIV